MPARHCATTRCCCRTSAASFRTKASASAALSADGASRSAIGNRVSRTPVRSQARASSSNRSSASSSSVSRETRRSTPSSASETICSARTDPPIGRAMIATQSVTQNNRGFIALKLRTAPASPRRYPCAFSRIFFFSAGSIGSPSSQGVSAHSFTGLTRSSVDRISSTGIDASPQRHKLPSSLNQN